MRKIKSGTRRILRTIIAKVLKARRMLHMINGKSVRDARIAAGFRTQSALAAKIGCSRVTISRAENGLGGTGILQKIAEATGVSPEALMQTSSEPAGGSVTKQEQELLAAFRKLDPVLQARAAGFVFGLAAGGGTEEGAQLGSELSSDLAAAEARRQAARNQSQQQTGDSSA